MISSSGVLSRLYLLPVKRDYHCTRLRFPPEFSYCMESRSFPSYGSFHSPDLHRCYSYHVPRPQEHIAIPMYNLSPVPASFPTFCHDQMYLYYFFILLQLFQQFYCKGRSGSPTHTDDKSLSHFSSFPDFSVHIKVCLKNFPTICTNYTRSFPISFAILLFTWIIPTRNT